NTVTSSGEIRNTPLRVRRSFQFADDAIACTVQLDESGYSDLLNLWVKNDARGKVKEAYEMLPFPPDTRAGRGAKKPTTVVLLDADGKPGKELGSDATEASGVLIDRGGFGVRILLDRPRPVQRGSNNTVMIRLTDKLTAAKDVALSYRLVPFGG